MTSDSRAVCSSLLSNVSGGYAELKIKAESMVKGTTDEMKTQSTVVKSSSHISGPDNTTYCGAAAGGPTVAGRAAAIIEALLGNVGWPMEPLSYHSHHR